MKWAALIPLLAIAGRCGHADPDESAAAPAAPSAATAAPGSPGDVADLLAALPGCDVNYRGTFLDLGAAPAEARRDHFVGRRDDVALSERSGVTVARVHTKRLSHQFTVLAPEKAAGVTVRVAGVASRQMNVYLDERRLGAVALSRDDFGFAVLSSPETLQPGTHTVTLRFSGTAQGADDPYADVDWIRIGSTEGSPEAYGPPTIRDIVTDVVLKGEPRRSLVLRSPGSVRCSLRVTPGMRLSTRLGYWGTGKGVARVRLFEDGEEPVVLAEHPVTGDAASAWKAVSIPLEPYAGRVVSIELVAADAVGGGRVAFGEPALHGKPDGAKPPPPARVAVVVLAAGLDRRLLPPWGPASGLGAMARLAREGAAFERYRAPTTVVNGVVASLLTGLPPRATGVEDPSSRLADSARLLSERAKEGNARAAFLTGVPMSFPAFGFDRGWERYESFSPVKDVPATEPLSLGASWLKEQLAADDGTRLLLVVHARGGHPPWDVTRDEVQSIPPEEYGGQIEPRAGALVLANLRVLRGPSDQRLSGDDWRRLRGLEELALKKQDVALRRILETLDKAGVYDQSLVVFVGDVGAGDPPTVPFAPMPALREDVLLAPLLVKFPGGVHAGEQVSTMVTTTDVTRTVLSALGLPEDGVEGESLERLARGLLPLDGRPLVATLGNRFSTRFGPWMLSGEIGRRPTLCLIEVDPSCATDALSASPIAAEALWRRTHAFESKARAARDATARAPLHAIFDAETQSALKVFGY